MIKFDLYLSESDFDRLFAEKDKRGRSDLTGNDFAVILLHEYLHKLQPSLPASQDGEYT